MADDYEGTPSIEAPDTSQSSEPMDSPDTSYDTQDTPDSGDSAGTEDASNLRRELEDLRKRVAGQTYSWQQERDRRLAHERRIERWRQAGLNPDEIDRAVETSLAQFHGQQYQQPLSPQQLGVVTRDELQNVIYNQRYVQTCEQLAEKYFAKNQDDDNPLFRRQIGDAAIRLANLEFQTHGMVVSSPEQLMRNAFNELNELKNVVTKRVTKSISETREKVKGQGVTDTMHRKNRPSDDDSEREMTPEDYVSLYRTHQQRVKSKR